MWREIAHARRHDVPSGCSDLMGVGKEGYGVAGSNGVDSDPRARAGEAVTNSVKEGGFQLPEVNFVVVA